MYHVKPSEVLNISDGYTAFCFDEACAVIMARMQNDEEPIFMEDEKPKHYRTFTEMMKDKGGCRNVC